MRRGIFRVSVSIEIMEDTKVPLPIRAPTVVLSSSYRFRKLTLRCSLGMRRSIRHRHVPVGHRPLFLHDGHPGCSERPCGYYLAASPARLQRFRRKSVYDNRNHLLFPLLGLLRRRPGLSCRLVACRLVIRMRRRPPKMLRPHQQTPTGSSQRSGSVVGKHLLPVSDLHWQRNRILWDQLWRYRGDDLFLRDAYLPSSCLRHEERRRSSWPIHARPLGGAYQHFRSVLVHILDNLPVLSHGDARDQGEYELLVSHLRVVPIGCRVHVVAVRSAVLSGGLGPDRCV